MATYAGLYGPVALLDDAGNVQPTATVTIRDAADAVNATVYADRTRGPLSNPLPKGVLTGTPGVDLDGVVIFYADPGRYVMEVEVGSTQTQYPIQVYSEEGDTDLSTQVELDTHIADTTNIHGITDTAELVRQSRSVSTDATLTGGGDLSANRTLGVDVPAEAERIRDVIGAALVAGSNVTVTVNDAGDTITVATPLTQYTDEMVRDVIGVALVAGTGLTITVNDAGDTITLAIDTTAEAERIRDVIGTALVAGLGIDVTVDDTGDTITLALDADAATQAELDAHEADTTGIHGIADTALLETQAGAASKVATHEADTTNVHGIADTANLAPKRLLENVQAGASYTLVLADESAVVACTNAGAVTVTVPPNSTAAFPIGALVEIFQAGAGQVTVAAGAGVTLRSPFGTKTQAQYTSAVLRKRATDEWVLSGEVIS